MTKQVLTVMKPSPMTQDLRQPRSPERPCGSSLGLRNGVRFDLIQEDTLAGKKGRSGPPGNLNNVRYAHRAWWRRKALRKEDKWIVPSIERYIQGLRSDKPDASEAEQRLMEVSQISRGATMLILAEAARNGFIVKDGTSWDLSPGAKDLPKFLSIERQALQTLGLERRAKAVPVLSEYIDSKKQTEEPQP